jgi:hypothetical protein
MVALTLTAGGVSHLIQGPDPIGLVGSAWTQAEFNVFGYDGGDTVEFNAGAQVTMGLTSDNDASGVIPDCPNASTTGENSNLLLGPCYTTSVPGIWFNESPTTPQIQSVSPSQGPAAGGTTVNLLGGPFDQQQFQITFGNPAVSPTNTLPNDVSVLSPPGKVGSSVDINAAYVFPNGGLGPFSAPVSFTYLPDPPACSFSILSCPFYQNQPPDYTIACPAPVDFYTTSDTNTPSDFNLIQQDATTNTGTTTDQQVSLAACKLGNKTQCTFDSTYVPVANWCINHNGGGGGGGGGSTTCSKCGGGQCCPNPYGGPGIVCVPKGKPCPPLQ